MLDIRTEHLYVYEAIAQRNSKVAVKAVINHLQAAKTRVVDELNILLSETEAT